MDEVIWVDEMAQKCGIKQPTFYDKRWKEQSGCPLFRQGKRLGSFRRDFEKWYRDRLRYA